MGLVVGCFSARGITEISSKPYPLLYQDDSTERLGEPDDQVFIEVRRKKISRPVDNLAIHYRSFFPGGVIIRPGDREKYVKVNGKTAYKVVLRTKYIRKRKRIRNPEQAKNPPPGWTVKNITDPLTGKTVPVLYGPVVPQYRILYLVEGDVYLYYIYMRADGDSIPGARKKFEEFVSKSIDYG